MPGSKKKHAEKPTGFEDALGKYGPQIQDGWCGEAVAWGFPITRRLGEERWAELGKYGSLEYVGEYSSGQWFLIVKFLRPAKAIKKYGGITQLKVGPRGGFKSVTYGDKTFLVKWLNPRDLIDWKTDPRVEIVR
ncbi:MAG TPA: hypothetical protein VGX23_05180 [Actinocrinis sp.]|nr:hypothetical protein [Actinocrinis sp.]